jgi:hypothetical protein
MRKNPRDKESGLPKAYVKGLSSSTAKARKAHWDRANKLSDRDPRAYEPAPGDANAKTVPSKATREVRKIMNKEEVEITEKAENSLAAKAKKFDVPLDTLKTVYRRGVAAWNSGHRPGTTPQQWGHARVNSYLRKGKGTYYGTDKDLRKEDVQIDEISKDIMKSYRGKALNQYVNATLSPKYDNHDSKEHKLAIKRARGLNMAHKKIGEAKDEREYGYEGEMVMSQLKGIMNHAQQLYDILKPDTDLPEWVQSKVTLAYDYLQTAADYMATEINEEWEVRRGTKVISTHKKKDEADVKAMKHPLNKVVAKEEAPVNVAGTGNVAGLGVGSQGEPGVKKKKKPALASFKRFVRRT